MKLRDYQETAVDKAQQALREHGKTLVVMATGLGKTAVFAEIIRKHLEENGAHRRVMVIAHREELIAQAVQTIMRVTQQVVAVEMGEQRSNEGMVGKAAVVVSSVQTQISGVGSQRRMHRFNANEFGLLVIDEAHHATADSYRAVIQHYCGTGKAKLLGVTATPDRTDEASLLELFQCCAMEYGIREGIENGWLVPIKQRYVSVNSLDIADVGTVAGDLNAKQLSAVLEYEAALHEMVAPTIEIVGQRRCLVFAASVAHAKRVTEILNRHRANCAAWVDGETPRDIRRERFRSFSMGMTQYLVNVGVATEGWDDAAQDAKGVQVIAMFRPTKSRALYSQMCGRGTRVVPNTLDNTATALERASAIAASAKPFLEVLDFVGNSGKHKLVHCASALMEGTVSERVVELLERESRTRSEAAPVDILALVPECERIARSEADAEKRKSVLAKAKYELQSVDPFDLVALSSDREQNWERGEAATPKQLALLGRLRVRLPRLCTKADAAKLIDAALGTPTAKQAAVLKRNGYDPSKFTRKTASNKITELMSMWESLR